MRTSSIAQIAYFALLTSCVGERQPVDFTTLDLISSDVSAYASNGAVVVTYSGQPGTIYDWVGIYHVGETNTNNWLAYSQTDGAPAGSVTIYGVPEGGPYVATFVRIETALESSTSFSVSSNLTLTRDAASYVSGIDTVVATFANAPTDAWFAVAPAGSSNITVTDDLGTQGVANGSINISAPPAGTYVLRCFSQTPHYVILRESASFTVTDPVAVTVSGPSTVDFGADINVAYSGFSGTEDVIRLAPVGSPMYYFDAYALPSGTSGSVVIPGGAAGGSYELRAFFNWSNESQRYTLRASQPITIVSQNGVGLSTTSAGLYGNDNSFSADISDATGGYRYVAFTSRALNLAGGDATFPSVFRKDRQTGTVDLVSVGLGGAMPDGSADKPRLSSNGNFVVFSSRATNLWSGVDANTWGHDIFLRNMTTGITTAISVNSSGVSTGNGDSQYPSVSDDGRYVVFYSFASDLVAGDSNGAADVFLRDTQTNTTTRVSVSSSGTEANAESRAGRISGDGRVVAFLSYATNLSTWDTTGQANIFVRDLTSGITLLASAGTTGPASGASYGLPEISTNGNLIVYRSWAANLVANDTDTNNFHDVFLYNFAQGNNLRVSTSGTTEPNDHVEGEGLSISDDGVWVTFATAASNLVANDTNGTLDVFLRNVNTGVVQRISQDSAAGQLSGISFRPSASSDGRRVVWETNSAASASDTNGSSDIYLFTSY